MAIHLPYAPSSVAGTYHQLATGSLLRSRYRIEQVIATTTMNTVYLAHDQHTGRAVVIKRLMVTSSDDKKNKIALRCLQREAHFLRAVDHSQLPHLRAAFRQEPYYYLVIDYIAGHTLETLLEFGMVMREHATHILDQLCDVIIYLHNQEKPIIHADIKPNNIIVTPNGRVLLLDFGLARYRGEQERSIALVGTPGFAPPEQWRGAALDERTDVYALGMLLKTLWGEPCHSQSVAEVIERATATAIEDRFSNVTQFRSALRLATAWIPVRHSVRELLLYHLRARISIILLAMALVVFLAVTSLLIQHLRICACS